MSKRIIKITGWLLTAVIGSLFSMSAFLKLTLSETAVTQAAIFGIDHSSYVILGIIEIISLILFIFPRTGVLGTLLLASYLGGAIATHLQHQQPVITAVIIQVILWVTAVVRFPELKHRLVPTAKQ